MNASPSARSAPQCFSGPTLHESHPPAIIPAQHSCPICNLQSQSAIYRRGTPMSDAKLCQNLIDGQWVAPANGRMIENRTPAGTRDMIGGFPDWDERDVQAA